MNTILKKMEIRIKNEDCGTQNWVDYHFNLPSFNNVMLISKSDMIPVSCN